VVTSQCDRAGMILNRRPFGLHIALFLTMRVHGRLFKCVCVCVCVAGVPNVLDRRLNEQAAVDVAC
jgi:hypothetical protein